MQELFISSAMASPCLGNKLLLHNFLEKPSYISLKITTNQSVSHSPSHLDSELDLDWNRFWSG